MEIFNRLSWNLKKYILFFHRPYFFDEIIINVIDRKIKRIFSEDECFYYKDDNFIIINEDEYYTDIYEILSDFVKSISVVNRYNRLVTLKNNVKITINMNFIWCILTRIQRIEIYFDNEIYSIYNPEENYINVYGIKNPIDVLIFFHEFDDIILDYDRYDWDDNGEIVYLFLNGEKDMKIHINEKNTLITYPVI
jgi:hypothetical protein